ncbi:hypothetical protein AB0K18_42810 [Nonomuraea sp. NPDC049421]|uniref:hypothetical protein n=1 Tax=Nonomuraea sp. NPDC049421 TaxID=3155275 RepID=UPI00343ADDE7
MWIYRNSQTGQVTELAARSPRLDALANWQLIGAPADEEPDPTGVGRALPSDPAPAADPAAVPAAAEAGPPATATGGEAAAELLSRPPDNAPKAVWVAYAVALGATEADARALKKEALIEEYGGTDGED